MSEKPIHFSLLISQGDFEWQKRKSSLSLVQQVRKEIGAIATPDVIQWAPGLPKTRSGKIMRRILRKIAANDLSNLGDTTTLADPSVVEDLIHNRAVK